MFRLFMTNVLQSPEIRPNIRPLATRSALPRQLQQGFAGRQWLVPGQERVLTAEKKSSANC